MINKNKYEKPLIIFATFLYPLFTLPWIIKYMIKNYYIGYILFALVMAYLAFLTIPYDTWDITRHFNRFEEISTLSIDDLLNYRVFLLILNFYMWIVANLGLPKEFIPFSITFVTYMLYFITLKKIVDFKKNQNKYIYFIIIALLLITNEIRFFGVASGLRNDLAYAIFIYALVDFILFRKKVKFYILSIFAIMIHISVLPLFIFFLLSKYIRLGKILKIVMVISFFIMISGLSEVVFYKIMELLKPFLQSIGLYFHAYMDPEGHWGSGFWVTRNFKTILFERYIKPLPFYIIGVYLIFNNKTLINKRITTYIYLLFIFVCIISISRTLFDRYNYFFVLLFIFVYLISINIDKLNKFFISLLIIAMVLVDMGSIVKYRDIYLKSWAKALYIPLPVNMTNVINKKDYIHRKSL